MDLTSLAAKQKRIATWMDLLGEIQDPALRSITEARLADLRGVIAECWQSGVISEPHAERIIDLERQLEQLNEDARMRVVAKGAVSF